MRTGDTSAATRRAHWSRHSQCREDGTAVIEFIFLGLLLLVPLAYLVLMFGRIQAGSYAATHAAREAGRVYVASTEATAAARAAAAARIAFEDQGFGDNGRLEIVCERTPCLQRDNAVTSTATVTVPLPFIPTLARGVVPLEVPVQAEQVTLTEDYRSYG